MMNSIKVSIYAGYPDIFEDTFAAFLLMHNYIYLSIMMS